MQAEMQAEMLFPVDADQAHYLTVMTDRWRWRTPSPNPSINPDTTPSSNLSATPSPNLNPTPGANPTAATNDMTRDSLRSGSVSPFPIKPSHSRTSTASAPPAGLFHSSPKLERVHKRVLSAGSSLTGSAMTKCGLVVGEGEGAPLGETPSEIDVQSLVTKGEKEASVNEETGGDEASGNSETSIDGIPLVIGLMGEEANKAYAVGEEIVVVSVDSSPAASLTRTCKWGGYKQLPDGCELTVGELREMAGRQQQQIESQQQLLVAREQRLKYLKQQESRAAAVAAEAERLRRLRERVEAQEAKLRRLRALRGQVEATRSNTASLTTDLDAMRHLFSEKEKELVVAVSKVEELTRQLEDLRHGRSPLNPNNQHHNELDKLRRELLYRNSVNREASARVAAQRETLAARRDEITRIDKRIAELQQRLHRKRIINHQLASQITAATQAKQAQLKAVQDNALRDGIHSENSADDIHAPDHLKLPPGEDLGEFGPNKNDPKYQTLPYNTKFSVTFKTKNQGGESDSAPTTPTTSTAPTFFPEAPTTSANNTNAPVNGSVRTVHSIPTHPPSRGHAHALGQQSQAPTQPKPPPNPAMTPRVYGPGAQQFNQRSQPLGGAAMGPNQDSRSLLPPTSLSISFNQKLSPGVTTHAQNRILLLPPHMQQQDMDRNASGSTGENMEEATTPTEGGVGRSKPALPPKPLVPSKPLPPPRQKGDPLLASNESLNNAQQSSGRSGSQGRPQQGYRYASQNVIMSTYTTQQMTGAENQSDVGDDSRSKPNNILNNNNKTDNDGGEKVHVSINSRIEMPPDFMFPEDETPPADLLGRKVEEIENGNGEGQSGPDAVDNFMSSSLPVSELEKLRIESIRDEKSQDDIPSDDSRQPDGADTSSVPIEEGRSEGEVEKNSSSSTIINNNNNNNNTSVVRRIKKGNLKTKNSSRIPRRVSFDPLALLLDAALEGELELVKRTAMEVPNPSAANDEGITALHNAICAGHLDIVTFLVTFGCDVNAQDSDGWTPLHCAASCNNVAMVRFLVEHGACILATTLSDHETAAEKCEQDEEGYDGCSQYLYSVQEKLGIMNGGVVFGVYDYEGHAGDELTFRCGDALTILRRGDEYEREWWWGQLRDIQGYVPRNLLGLYPRVKSPIRDS